MRRQLNISKVHITSNSAAKPAEPTGEALARVFAAL
jgi:hypothetical protein